MLYLKKSATQKDIEVYSLSTNLIDIQGENISLENRITIIVFFNTQCDLCLSEINLLNEKADQLNQQFNLVIVSFEPEASLQAFFERYNLNNKENIFIISDSKERLLDDFNIEIYPSFVIIDNDNLVMGRGNILTEKIIEELLILNTFNSKYEN